MLRPPLLPVWCEAGALNCKGCRRSVPGGEYERPGLSEGLRLLAACFFPLLLSSLSSSTAISHLQHDTVISDLTNMEES